MDTVRIGRVKTDRVGRGGNLRAPRHLNLLVIDSINFHQSSGSFEECYVHINTTSPPKV